MKQAADQQATHATRRQLGALTAADLCWGPPHLLLWEGHQGGHHLHHRVGKEEKPRLTFLCCSHLGLPFPALGSNQSLWTLHLLNWKKELGKGEKLFYCYCCTSGCLQGGPGVFTSPGNMSLSEHSHMHHMHMPGTPAPTPHPGAGLGSRLTLHHQFGCTAAHRQRCWFSHLFLSWKYIFKKNQEGRPSRFHKQCCVCWDEGKHDIHSPFPSKQRPATNLPLFSSHVYPSLATSTQQLFPACCEKQVSHLSLQLVVSTSLIWKPPAVMTRSNERLLIEGPCDHPWPQSCRSC